jgi:hypothetical protein
MNSDMDIITDMFGDTLQYDNDEDTIDTSQKNKEYYIGKAENILKQLNDTEHYYFFLMTFLKNFNNLELEQKMFIKSLIIEKKQSDSNDNKNKNNNNEIKKKKNKKNLKPKLNIVDDY